MEIQLRTLTPLWTGGIHTGQMDRLHETGIIGSLRWWYEAIVRGQNSRVCDPISNDSCQFDAKAYEEAKKQKDPEAVEKGLAKVCPACRLFGCTGWRRQFQLVVAQDQTQPAWSSPPDTLNVRPPDRSRGWFLPPGRSGTLTLRLHGPQQNQIRDLFLALEEWGSLGAKPQLGYGFFSLANRQELSNSRTAADPPLPNLAALPDFGFFRYRFQPPTPQWWTRLAGIERLLGGASAAALQQLARQQMLPLAPILKNGWRFHQWRGERRREQVIFGALRPERQRSKIAVSWAYRAGADWEIRGWVHLPESEYQGHNLRQILTDEAAWQEALQVTTGTLTTAGLLAVNGQRG